VEGASLGDNILGAFGESRARAMIDALPLSP
jgi:hypothetical protein